MIVFRSINEEIRKDLDFNERENKYDNGLISAWEIGREQASTDKELARKTKNGELPLSVFKGGFKEKLKTKTVKYGTFKYLAQMQGLKGVDLDIDTDRDEGIELICSTTKMKSIFTSDINKLKNQ